VAKKVEILKQIGEVIKMSRNTNIKKIYDLAPMQEGMLFHALLDDGNDPYMEQIEIILKGSINPGLFENALNMLVERHDILKTVFIHDKLKKPQQVVLKERSAVFHYEDISNLDRVERESVVSEYTSKDRQKGFNLSKDILVRAAVFKTFQDSYKMVFSFHHIIMDGWSLGVFFKEFLDIYGALRNKMQVELEGASSYEEYIRWLGRQDRKDAKNFWKQYLEGYENVAVFPKSVMKLRDEDSITGRIYFSIDEDSTKKLEEFSKKNFVTMAALIQSIWGVLLSRYNNTQDVAFGSVTSGRSAEVDGIEKMVGLFINTVPLRIRYDDKECFSNIARRIQEDILDSEKYGYIPLAEIQGQSTLKSSLIDHVLAYENFAVDKELADSDDEADELGFSMEEMRGDETVNYDFSIKVSPSSGLEFEIVYNKGLYDERIIRNIEKHVKKVVDVLTSQGDFILKDLDIVTQEERKQILFDFNSTEKEVKDNTIHGLFEEMVEVNADKTALVYKNDHFTYSELNKRANRLAHRLMIEGVGSEDIIGLMVNRGIELVVGMLAILKAGCAYLPLDPNYPSKRLEYMLCDSKTKILLAESGLENKVKFQGKVINIDNDGAYDLIDENPEVLVNGKNLAYMIYTSGSTGRPKGVMMEHKGLANVKCTLQEIVGVNSSDSTVQFASSSFDASVWEIAMGILTGGTLYIVEKETIGDYEKFVEFINKNNITIATLPPTYITNIEPSDVKSLRTLITAGSATNFDLVRKWKDAVVYINGYGPTESTVCATLYRVKDDFEKHASVPIGKPIFNTKIFILDSKNRLLPAGIPGELCISALGLARGYFDRPELTAEKFIENPFVEEYKDCGIELSDLRLYRSGDLARWLPDGNIEFLGRIDHQVKIRGFRIELGEIEEQLLSADGIKQAVVIDREDSKGEKYICAYYVSDSELSAGDLRNYLSKELPEYMLPSFFVRLDKIPVTVNDKVDRKALPDPLEGVYMETSYEAPRNETEKKMAKLFEEILEVENIGIRNNFFELGGHSLKATVLISRIHKEFNVKVPLKEVFNRPTVEGMCSFIIGADKIGYEDIKPAQLMEYYPLSAAQKRLYIVNQIEEGMDTSYNMVTALKIEGDLDRQKVQDVFGKLVERHEALRTSFHFIDSEPVQKIHENLNFNIEYFEADDIKAQHILGSFVKPFDLTKAPLLRVGLIKTGTDKHILIVDMHHIISDGGTMGLLVDEFTALYIGKELKPLKIQYKDFALWQKNMIDAGRIKEQEKFWLDCFKGDIPVLSLPTDVKRPSAQSFEGDVVFFETGKDVLERLKELARNNGTTMFMVLLASFYTVLSKYSGQEDIVVGTSASGRNHPDIENVAGMFVNTLALRSNPMGNKSFIDFLAEVKDNTIKAFENQDYQFEELVEKLNVPRDISRNPLFDVMFTLQNQRDKDIEIEGLSFSECEMDYKNSMFDISMDITENEDGIFFALQFCTAIFRKETMERFIRHLINVLEVVTKNPRTLLMDIDMLSKEDRYEILSVFNEKNAHYDFNQTVHTLFETHAANNPHKEAIVFEGEKVTYKELNEKANRIAQFIMGTGFKNNDLVGIMLERSPYMLQSIMGVWKAGGAYIPIDVNYPVERKLVILNESTCSYVITLSSFVDDDFKSKFRGRIICLDLIYDRLLKEATTNPGLHFNPEDLAYVLFTSGSTGNPKGVMIHHRGMINHILAQRDDLGLDSSIVFAQNANHCFDISVWQMFGALALGGTTVIYSNDDVMEVGKFTQSIIRDGVTLLEVVPSYLSVMMDYIEGNKLKPNSLEYLMVTGETVHLSLLKRWFGLCPAIKVVNAYGPAEASDDIAQYIIDEIPKVIDTVPIGKPLSNIDIYILDKNLKVCPVGVVGEICVAGAGVGIGYINNTEKTKESFINNPVCDREGYSTLYRTGDIGRFLPDGNIEFFGRKDYQVKIRGFRIELGEIENRIASYDKVKDAAVVDLKDENGNKYLCAYFTSDFEVDIDELKEFLMGFLPEYMIPAYFLKLDKLPLSSNGKVDRKALPCPNTLYEGVLYIAPESDTEKGIEKIWMRILDCERVGVNDDFFNIGGHSLKAAVMTSMIHKQFDVQVPLKEIFKLRTIKNIAKYIEVSEKQEFSSIQHAAKRPYYPLSSAQKRLFIVNSLNHDSLAYNMPEVLQLEGMLDVERFRAALKSLVNRHESLRTSFDMVDEQPVQIVHEDIETELEFYEAEDEEKILQIIDGFIKPFDLKRVPLFRSALISVSPSKHVFIYDMHHIISDGSSLEIFAADLALLYDGHELPELKIQYRDFAIWQNKLIESGEIEKQKQYWLEKFSGEIPQIDLPLDFNRPSVRSHEGEMIEAIIPEALTERLKKLCDKTGTTLYIMLMACYNVLLSKYSGQEDIVVGTLTAGRSHVDVQNLIGMFVNTLAIRNVPSSQKAFADFLAEVKENALNAFENQDYQFEELVENLDLIRETGRNPLFDTMFIMQNVNSPDTGESGLRFDSFEKHEFMTSRFDISMQVEEREDELVLGLVYCKKLFKKETMEKMAGHFINIIESIAQNPGICLKDIKMLSEAEKKEVVYDFNKDASDIVQKTIQEVFEIQARRYPDRTAVVLKEDNLSFAELNRKANSLARLLRNKGVTRNNIVAIMVDRSVDMIIGILGILKAGGAYLPIDPSYPKDRVEFMLCDSGSNLLLTKSELSQKVGDSVVKVLLDDDESYKEDSSDIELINTPHDLCYVIYTSGTTGKPKGVLIEHRNVAYLVSGLSKIIYERYKEPLKIAMFAPYVFDASVKQIFASLLLGHTLCLVPDEIRWDVVALAKYYRELGVDVSDGTPTLINMLIEGGDSVKELNAKHYLIGGEALHVNTVRKFFELYKGKGIVITNVYGPTECCVDATYFHIDENTVETIESIPIGKPMPNAQIYILGKHNELLCKGAKGEICIGGSGLGRGYLNRDELNKEKFVIVNVDEMMEPNLIYKTGDMGKWLADGYLEYLGRYDDQVKIRGHRIELGEIEKSIQKNELVRQAVVIDRDGENGAKYLCAYIVAEGEVLAKEFREILGKELPQYMIPSYFVKLDSIPLTRNGKLDKKALPEPFVDMGGEMDYKAPTDEIQEILVEIWKEVLGAHNIGINHDFFELGGDSIKSIQIASRLRKYKLFMDVRDLFENPTIDGLSPYIKPLEREIFQGTVIGSTGLTPIQTDFFTRNLTDMHHYNQAVMLHNTKGFDKNLIEKVFGKIVEHHDALRMVFKINDDSVTQYNRGLEGKLFDLSTFDYTRENDVDSLISKEASKIQGGIDLEEGPLVKLGLFKTTDGDHLLVCIHHLVVDGVSWRILIEDFTIAYEQAINNEEIELQPKTDSFKDWCDKISLYADGKKVLRAKEYWREIESREIQSIPYDYDNAESKLKDIKVLTLELDEKTTESLLKEANKAYNTNVSDLLLAALGLAVRNRAGSDNILVGLEGHGRENIIEDIDITRTVGWFTALYPVVLDVSKPQDLSLTIKVVKENLNSVPDNGIGYGVLKYITSDENKEDIGFTLNPQIVFNYLGEFGQESDDNDIIDISSLSCGDSASSNMEVKYPIEITGEASDGRLSFNFNYDSRKFKAATIESIIKDYRQNLLMIVEHCLGKENTEITPSDLTGEGLSIDDLDDIFGILEDKLN